MHSIKITFSLHICQINSPSVERLFLRFMASVMHGSQFWLLCCIIRWALLHVVTTDYLFILMHAGSLITESAWHSPGKSLLITIFFPPLFYYFSCTHFSNLKMKSVHICWTHYSACNWKMPYMGGFLRCSRLLWECESNLLVRMQY